MKQSIVHLVKSVVLDIRRISKVVDETSDLKLVDQARQEAQEFQRLVDALLTACDERQTQLSTLALDDSSHDPVLTAESDGNLALVEKSADNSDCSPSNSGTSVL